MTPFIIAFWPRLVGALLGAIVAGVLNRHQPAWHEAVVHCVGGSFVGAGIAAWFFATPVVYANVGFFHVLAFWLTVPSLFGSGAALIATRKN